VNVPSIAIAVAVATTVAVTMATAVAIVFAILVVISVVTVRVAVDAGVNGRAKNLLRFKVGWPTHLQPDFFAIQKFPPRFQPLLQSQPRPK
jgi:hypothetical protein